MTVRPSMKRYLESLNDLISFENGVLFYALWTGYKEQPDTAEILRFMEQKGVKIHTLHTSGHADAQSIDELISAVLPKIIVPIHTENADYFTKFSGERQIVSDTDMIKLYYTIKALPHFETAALFVEFGGFGCGVSFWGVYSCADRRMS